MGEFCEDCRENDEKLDAYQEAIRKLILLIMVMADSDDAEWRQKAKRTTIAWAISQGATVEG